MRLMLLFVAIVASSYVSANPDNDVEEVIVTGSRSVEQIREVPASVSIIDREVMQQQLKTSPELQKMLSFSVPGLGPSTGSTSNSGLSLRGRKALVLIDGVPQSTPLRDGSLGVRTIDASALERIEVVKGASSVYGSGASGGVINYITRMPDADSEFSGDVGFSSRFSMVEFEDSLGNRFDGTITGTIDRFSYVVNAVYDARGQQKDADGDTQGLVYGLSDVDTTNLFSKFGYAIDSDKSLQLTYNLYDSQQSTDLVDVNGVPNTGEKTYATENSGSDRPGEPQGPKNNYNLMLKYEDANLLDNTSLTADAYQQKIENVFFFSSNLANPDEGYDGGQSIIRSEKQGLRLSLRSDFGGDLVDSSLLYGVDWLNDITSQPLVDGRMWVPEMDMTARAAYLQGKWTVNQDWVFKAGARRETTDIVVDDYSTLKLCRSATQCSTPVDVKGGTLKYAATTYNLGMRYIAIDAFNPFISYSEGLEIPDLGRLLRTATVTDMADIRTEPSKVKHYEVGFSSSLGLLDLEFSAYKSTSELGTGTEYNADTGIFMPTREPQEMRGWEVAADLYVNESLSVLATYSHLEGENPDTGEPLDGRQVYPDKFTLFTKWQPTLNSSINLSYMHIADRKEFEPNDSGTYSTQQGPVSSYQLVDISASWQLDEWEIYGGIENLLNEDYFPTNAQATSIASYYSKGLGRTGTLGVKYNF
ncbi:TonB-dependent receptor [Oceanobacter mangrovi]|uniref:TonB-dependent receptor n=1 Tax=Oceanobacter mangrovi TaxID=2862510 RepID=UPI001C8E4EA5|nr:TonB-dependent receptor [Oceanobacter mangrovi]